MDTFFDGYLTCALWSSNDESDEDGGAPMDQTYDETDIAPETYLEMRRDCQDFLARCRVRGLTDVDNSQGGHDFWLTRNGHGAGFWDGDWGDQGDALTAIAEEFGSTTLYVGDDNQIHAA